MTRFHYTARDESTGAETTGYIEAETTSRALGKLGADYPPGDFSLMITDEGPDFTPEPEDDDAPSS